jgi:hypothetical protein
MYAYEIDDCRADYKNNYSGAISEGYAPRCIPEFWARKLISNRDPRFKNDLWQALFKVVGTKIDIFRRAIIPREMAKPNE